MEITAISSIGNLDMIALKPHQVVMSCELEEAESFYRFWEGLAYDRIMIQVITTGSFIEDLSEYFEGYAYKVIKTSEKRIPFPIHITESRLGHCRTSLSVSFHQ